MTPFSFLINKNQTKIMPSEPTIIMPIYGFNMPVYVAKSTTTSFNGCVGRIERIEFDNDKILYYLDSIPGIGFSEDKIRKL
jgi:hypothetical protein